MSLSQKHSGLILVPWFNSQEWRYVFESAYSDNKEKQFKALELLKVWKLRTPILSTGVEGTLILLEALLIDKHLPEDQVSNVYAVALMRFLNLSAANSKKQGDFTKTSSKHELPKWLTDLRHDIAHGHQIPSAYNLKMGLNFGFSWLKEKYWIPQSKLMKDFYVPPDVIKNDFLIHSLKSYIDVNLMLFMNEDLETEYIESLTAYIFKKTKRRITHPYLMLQIFEEMIKQSLDKDSRIESLAQCFELLVSGNGLLSPQYEKPTNKEELEKINIAFRNSWRRILNMFHQYNLLFCIVNKLFDILCDISYSDDSKKMAALWIDEILEALEGLRQSNTMEESTDKFLDLRPNTYLYTVEAFDFQIKVLYFSNKYQFYFLDRLLKYTVNDHETFNSDAEVLANTQQNAKDASLAQDKIYTFEDLKIGNLNIDDVDFESTTKNEQANLTSKQSIRQVPATSKWKKIEDTSIFKNCPLGVLPHQINQKHPFILDLE